MKNTEKGEMVLDRIEDFGVMVCMACNFEMEEVPFHWAWSCWGCAGLSCVSLFHIRLTGPEAHGVLDDGR